MSDFSSPSQLAYRYIDSNERLLSLKSHVNEIMRWQRIWSTIVPKGLTEVSRIGQIQADSISIYCDNGAAAAKLRQLTPSISAAFAKHGIINPTILVKVRTNAIPQREHVVHKPDLSKVAITEIARLTQDIEEGELKTALEKLLSKHQ
jgi:hypothetical protein